MCIRDSNNSIDSNNASDNDFAPFLNIMNEWYAKDTSNKIKAVFDARTVSYTHLTHHTAPAVLHTLIWTEAVVGLTMTARV